MAGSWPNAAVAECNPLSVAVIVWIILNTLRGVPCKIARTSRPSAICQNTFIANATSGSSQPPTNNARASSRAHEYYSVGGEMRGGDSDGPTGDHTIGSVFIPG